MKSEHIVMSIDDLKIGTVIQAKAGRATPTCRVYKVNTIWAEYYKRWHSSVWSILVRRNKKTGEWEEECCMVSNDISRITHIFKEVDGKEVRMPVTLVERYVDE